MSTYRETIRDHLARAGHTSIDARHVEAWMRIENPTLDGLSAARFGAEALAAACCVIDAGDSASEALASTFGL